MPPIPTDRTLDSTLALMREGFPFIRNRCSRLRSDLFQTRIMGMRVLCMSGRQAAEIFYDPARFVRNGAVPRRVRKTLLGENGVQTMDDEAHRHRKAMFMSLMDCGSMRRLTDLFEDSWRAALPAWEARSRVVLFVLFDEAQELLCRSVCLWAGVPLRDSEARRRASDCGLMVDGFGGVGLRSWRGKAARRRTEKWIGGLVDEVRRGTLPAAPGTALHVIASHRDSAGNLLDTHTAAVEVINVLRPTVAIATWITFAALALHEHPEWQRRLREACAEDDERLTWFVQEVRRYYPFGPFAGARVRTDFEWRGADFKKGTLVLLDLYGTNRDPREWQEPERFAPRRFRNWSGNPFSFIPQGGGGHHSGHRCAGERITIELLKAALRLLVCGMEYEVPPQNLHFPLSRMPTLPKSGFVMRKVRAVMPDSKLRAGFVPAPKRREPSDCMHVQSGSGPAAPGSLGGH
ncbi:MAG: cytochrome P450 [Verrucomicrobiaceae bacterium]|nr:MAG: cytochrome P450 [Verrucomicrobiaceae bacterium]